MLIYNLNYLNQIAMPPVIIFMFGLFLQNISIRFNRLVWNGKNKFERVQPNKRKPSWAKNVCP